MKFSIGELSIYGLIAAAIFYTTVYLLRMFDKWRMNDNTPMEKFVPTVIIVMVIGFVGGSFLQPIKSNCVDQGIPLFQCLAPSLKG